MAEFEVSYTYTHRIENNDFIHVEAETLSAALEIAVLRLRYEEDVEIYTVEEI